MLDYGATGAVVEIVFRYLFWVSPPLSSLNPTLDHQV